MQRRKTMRLLIVEDESEIVRFLKLELEHEGYQVESCPDGASGLERALTGAFDLVLLDVMLPQLNGLEALRRLRKTSAVPVILVTARDAVMEKVNGLDLGANDYITKPFHIEELLARIRMVLRNAEPAAQSGNSDMLTLGDLTLSLSSRQVMRAGQAIELTKTQYDLLEYLLRNRDIVLTRDQILSHVWGYSYAGNSNVVDVYVRYVRNKIHDMEESRIIETVRGIGYVIRDKTRKE
ncbi:MAG: DNA-binding response regulator [Firmicutes bacterium HGW-Firmicutes-9]|nr:MAG: DNA-binding response regulator [Firmicutes bacterium HGW-Firmicutes-9]